MKRTIFTGPAMMQIGAVLFAAVTLCLAASLGDPGDNCADKNFHTMETETTKRENCGPAFQNRCFCHTTCYQGHHQRILNCTNAGFNSTDPLEHIPNNTRALIFTGNNLTELHWNVFGPPENLNELRVVDMSRNNIQYIRGKTYHHVKHVEQLILDSNQISLEYNKTHPRVFSNFESLVELHLTDAFEDRNKTPSNLANILHSIFVNSNLTQLNKLHLEKNEISEFQDPNVFCDLPRLTFLYLASNSLSSIRFNTTCLPKLEFLDLAHNNFTSLSKHDIRVLDSLDRKKNQALVDFDKNPFECGCKLNILLEWMNRTNVNVRNKHLYRCREHGGKQLRSLQFDKNCGLKSSESTYSGSTVALWLLSLILIALILALIYVQRVDLKKKLEPVIDSVSKRVRYTSIATGDVQKEMDV